MTESSLLSIGEFARRTGLAVSAARFYADRGVLVPTATDPETGYRYYSEGLVEVARLIRDLRRIEMPLSQVIEVVDMALPDRRAAIAEHVARLESRLRGVHDVARNLVLAPSPRVAQEETSVRFSDLSHAIRQVLAMAGTDPMSPHLMCVRVEARDGSVRFVTTDSYRLSVRDLVPSSSGPAFNAVVAAAALSVWLSDLAGGEVVGIDLDGEHLVGRGRGVEARVPLVPVEFPDYENVLQRSTRAETTVVIDRDRFLSLLEGFAGDDAIRLTVSGGELIASRAGIEARVDVQIVGPPAALAINPRFAADAAVHAVGSDLVIEIDDDIHPVVFRSADDGTYTSLLMPVKTD